MDSASGKTFATINPVTEEKICDVAEGDKVSLLNVKLPRLIVNFICPLALRDKTTSEST